MRLRRLVIRSDDRLWSLIAIPCSWIAAASVATGGLSGSGRLGVLSVVLFVMAMAPIFPLVRAVWAGRTTIDAAAKIAMFGVGAGLLTAAALPLLDRSPTGFTALLLLLIGLGFLAAGGPRRSPVAWDSWILVVGSGTGITGFWLGLEEGIDPAGVGLGFLVYGLGTSLTTLTQLERGEVGL